MSLGERQSRVILRRTERPGSRRAAARPAPARSSAAQQLGACFADSKASSLGPASLASGGPARRKPGRRAPDLYISRARLPPRCARARDVGRRGGGGRRRRCAYSRSSACRCGSPPNAASGSADIGGGRNAFALFAEGGLYQRPMPWQFNLDAYLQGGVVGVKSRDWFVDGALALTRPVYSNFSGRIRRVGRRAAGPLSGRCRSARDDARAQQHPRASRLAPASSRAMRSPGPVRRSRWRAISNAARLGRSRCLRLVLGSPMDIYLPIAGQSVNALLIIAARLPGRRAVRHVRRRRRLPDHAAADLLRHPADGRGRLGDDPDHRRQRLRRRWSTCAAAAST